MGKTGEVVRVACCSTRSEQSSLFRTLFDRYGFVWQGPERTTGNREFVAYLNLSSSFLLPKQDAIESWILETDSSFTTFWAGYVDAEGCFSIGNRNTGQFRISSYDIGILRAAWHRLHVMGIPMPPPRLKRLAGTPDKKGIINRKDVWELASSRKDTLLSLCDLLSPHLKHCKRRQDMEKVRQNVVARNAKMKKS